MNCCNRFWEILSEFSEIFWISLYFVGKSQKNRFSVFVPFFHIKVRNVKFLPVLQRCRWIFSEEHFYIILFGAFESSVTLKHKNNLHKKLIRMLIKNKLQVDVDVIGFYNFTFGLGIVGIYYNFWNFVKLNEFPLIFEKWSKLFEIINENQKISRTSSRKNFFLLRKLIFFSSHFLLRIISLHSFIHFLVFTTCVRNIV